MGIRFQVAHRINICTYIKSDRLLELFFLRERDAVGTISSAFGFLKQAKRAVLTGHNMTSIFFGKQNSSQYANRTRAI
jgi:hypothetical protein